MGLSSPGCSRLRGRAGGGSVAWMQPHMGASTLRPTPTWVPPRQRGPAAGSPGDGWEGAGQEPTAAVPPPRGRSRLAPRAVPCPWLGRGCREPSPPPAAPAAVRPMQRGSCRRGPPRLVGTRSPPPNNCRAKYSPAGGRCPAEDACAKPSPSRGSPAPGAAVTCVPVGTSVSPPGTPLRGARALPSRARWPRRRARCQHPGWLGPFPLPCPKSGPFPSSWGLGAVVGPAPCPPAGLRGRPGRIRCQEVILARGGGGQREVQVLRGASWGWHPSGPLPVPRPRLPRSGQQVNVFLFFWQEEENGNRAGEHRRCAATGTPPVQGDVTARLGGHGALGVRGCHGSQRVLVAGGHRLTPPAGAVTLNTGGWCIGGSSVALGVARCPQSPWEGH